MEYIIVIDHLQHTHDEFRMQPIINSNARQHWKSEPQLASATRMDNSETSTTRMDGLID